MEDFNTYRNKQVRQLNKNECVTCPSPNAMGIGDDFTASKYFGNMRFSPKLRKKLSHKQDRSKSGMI